MSGNHNVDIHKKESIVALSLHMKQNKNEL